MADAAEVDRDIVAPGAATLSIPVPVNRESVCCAPEPGAPQVPGAWKLAPPSNDNPRMVFGVPVNARLTLGEVPLRNRFAVEAMYELAEPPPSVRIAPELTVTSPVPSP